MAVPKGMGIITILCFLVLICGIGYLFIQDASAYFESEWDTDDDTTDTSGSDTNTTDSSSLSGSWGEEVIIYFSDGTHESLKTVVDGQDRPLSVNFENKEVSSFQYMLHAKASGVGYTETSIDTTDFTVSFDTYDNFYSNSKVNSIEAKGDSVETIPLDSSWHNIFSVSKEAEKVVPGSLDANAYTIRLQPGGSLSYDDGTGTFVDVSLPDYVQFTVVKTVDNYINVEFKSGYTTLS